MELVINEAESREAYAAAMHEAVDEVFEMMMGMASEVITDCPVVEPEVICAFIGLAGAMSGTCMLRSSERSAARMASALTGSELDSLDDTVKDAIGEICNMIAGAWKGKFPAFASNCMLSTPTVITGTNYSLHTQRPAFHLEHYYGFEGHYFSVTLLCDSMQ